MLIACCKTERERGSASAYMAVALAAGTYWRLPCDSFFILLTRVTGRRFFLKAFLAMEVNILFSCFIFFLSEEKEKVIWFQSI